MEYNYFLGGITIATDIYYPELLPSTFLPDATLYYGDVPEHLENNTVNFPFIEANEHQYLLRLPRVGRYLVQNGDTIIIQKDGEVSARELEKQVLTSPFGVLSYQRDFVPFHGGAFIHKGKAVIISGMSAAGKSSVLASLYNSGYTVISDDISNIKIINGKAFLYPSFPRIMIWKDTAAILNIEVEHLEKLREEIEKYFYPINSIKTLEPVEIKKFIFLIKHGQPKSNITGLEKIELFKENVFHPWMMNAFNKQLHISRQIFFSLAIDSPLVLNSAAGDIKQTASSIINSLS